VAGHKQFASHVRGFGLLMVAVSACSAQAFIPELKAEHDPGRRSELALEYADEAFDSASSLYKGGDIHKGDAELDNMTAAVNECLEALSGLHKARLYKRAELKVATLQRRLQDLEGTLEIEERGWADQTIRKLEELHDKLLDGVMRK
jgi:hypothetical protein